MVMGTTIVRLARIPFRHGAPANAFGDRVCLIDLLKMLQANGCDLQREARSPARHVKRRGPVDCFAKPSEVTGDGRKLSVDLVRRTAERKIRMSVMNSPHLQRLAIGTIDHAIVDRWWAWNAGPALLGIPPLLHSERVFLGKRILHPKQLTRLHLLPE